MRRAHWLCCVGMTRSSRGIFYNRADATVEHVWVMQALVLATVHRPRPLWRLLAQYDEKRLSVSQQAAELLQIPEL